MANPYLGEIKIFAGIFNPRGYAFCNGTVLSVSQNTALFSLLGTIYGGNGVSTFALPEMRGRIGIHAGQGPGLSPYQQGEVLGSEKVTLTVAQMPNHNHYMMASTEQATTATLDGNVLALNATPPPEFFAESSTGAPVTFASNSLMSVGGSQPHTNLAPLLAVNYIIALQGVFAPRP